jgi:hypothetical protein
MGAGSSRHFLGELTSCMELVYVERVETSKNGPKAAVLPPYVVS